MARSLLGVCLMLVVASNVIYEAQGHFLLKTYLRKNFPRKCNEFTPFANKGMSTFLTDLEGSCPPTAEFKNFFTSFKSYMTFIETASSEASKNVDVEMTTKADGLFQACSALAGGQGGKSADVGNFKVTMISMGKTLVEQKKNTRVMTTAEKKRLVMAMVKWTKMIATFVKTASAKKGKTIDIATYGLDVNESSIVSSSSTKTESRSSTKTEVGAGKGSVSSKKKESSGGSSSLTNGESSTNSGTVSGGGKVSSKTKESTSTSSGSGSKTGSRTGTTYSDTTGAKSASRPTASPSVGGKSSVKENSGGKGSASSMGKESKKGSASSMSKEESTKSGTASSSTTSVKQVETETSKEAMSFIMDLEKKYSGKAELKVFFEKLKASMTASSTISSKTTKDYVSGTRSATGKLSEAMAFVGSRYSKSAQMKSNMETAQEKLMRTLKELQDINSKIVSAKTVTSTQQSEIKQTLTKWEQVTTQFVETASSSSSSSSSSSASSEQGTAKMVKTN